MKNKCMVYKKSFLFYFFYVNKKESGNFYFYDFYILFNIFFEYLNFL